jgi:cytochrome c556
MARQEPADFPPAYHDLAMAHHAAAQKLADVMPTKDLKRILPEFNNVLRACVACHLEYRLDRS